MVPYTLRRQALGRSVIRGELPRYQAMANAIIAPTRNRTAAISDQGRAREPRRVHTFIPAKNTCARTIHARPAAGRGGRERREGAEGGDAAAELGMRAILDVK